MHNSTDWNSKMFAKKDFAVLLTPGDGLLTFDDVNKREWLDLSESLLEQFPGDNLEENYQSVVTETGVSGIFEGFSVAKGDDAEALAISAGIDIVLRSGLFEHNLIPTTNIINLLGVTHADSATDFGSFGAIDETGIFFGGPRRIATRFIVDDQGRPGNIGSEAGLH